MGGMNSFRTAAAIAAGLLFGTAGCNLLSEKPIRDSLSLEQQAREIQQIVPLATPRDKAVRLLNEAGIVGEFATRFQTVYHCERWNRPDGERYHLNVALMFDEHGRLREIRESDASFSPDARSGQDVKRAPKSVRPANRQLPVTQADRASVRDVRSGARMPFAKEQ